MENDTRSWNRPDYHHCLVNLANSVLKRFGVATTADSLSLADRYLNGYKNVVILLLDALGTSILEKHLDEDGFFRRHLVGSFESVYPPTTVAATTSIRSGLYPNEHGWLGWDMYYPQIDKTVTVFLNIEQRTEIEGAVPSIVDPEGNIKWSQDSLNKKNSAADYNVIETFSPYKDIIDKINDAGGSAYSASPYMPPFPKNLDEILTRVETLCKLPGDKYIYAYWEEPDSTIHKTGTLSHDTHEMVRNLEKRVENTVASLRDTVLLIVADHGIIDTQNLCVLDYPEIMKCLKRLPFLEARTPSFFVKDEYMEEFPSIFHKAFGNDFLLLTREEAIKDGLFGIGDNRSDLREMLGDYVALSISDKSLFKTHYEAQKMVANHAGLTRQELTIPLIVVEKK